jgi:hypothetical protein
VAVKLPVIKAYMDTDQREALMTIASYSKFHQDVVQGVEVQGGRNKVVSTKAPFGRLTHVRRGGVSHARSGGRSYRDVAQLTTFFAQQIFGLNSLNVSKHVALSSFNLPVRCVFCMHLLRNRCTGTIH